MLQARSGLKAAVPSLARMPQQLGWRAVPTTALKRCVSTVSRLPGRSFVRASWCSGSRRVGGSSQLLLLRRWVVLPRMQQGVGCARQFATQQAVATEAGVVAPRSVAYWLFGCGAAVFAMVVLGGVTRLTRSGLSMVEWKLQGSRLPRGDEEWQAAFDKYKQYPEFQLSNFDMTLEEFKSIYFMEWLHRMWGRGLGVLFGLPALYFVARGRIPRFMYPRLGLLFGLGGLQGLVGWWMVRSGLHEDTIVTKSDPRVSPYRLAAHLSMALTTYSLLMWTGWQVLAKAAGSHGVAPSASVVAAGKRILPFAAAATGAVGLTAFVGAFVAGLDAGHAYNDWPRMAERWVPEEIWQSDLGWRNLFENSATVQFNHRLLAYGTVASAVTLLVVSRRTGAWKEMPRAVRVGVSGLSHGIPTQALLGIGTLMMYVPTYMGALHQALAVTVWTMGLYGLHVLRILVRQGGNAAVKTVKAATKKQK